MRASTVYTLFARRLSLGLLVVLGLLRRVTCPALLAVTAVTLVGVWQSVVDPWGWHLEGTNALFVPSLIIFAAALVLLAVRDEDHLVLARGAAGFRPRTAAGA